LNRCAYLVQQGKYFKSLDEEKREEILRELHEADAERQQLKHSLTIDTAELAHHHHHQEVRY
jgi:hypothetical protein